MTSSSKGMEREEVRCVRRKFEKKEKKKEGGNRNKLGLAISEYLWGEREKERKRERKREKIKETEGGLPWRRTGMLTWAKEFSL